MLNDSTNKLNEEFLQNQWPAKKIKTIDQNGPTIVSKFLFEQYITFYLFELVSASDN